MNAQLPDRMTVDEFLPWSVDQESGRFELEHGRVVRLAQENIGHVCSKASAYHAVASAIARGRLPYFALVNGLAVKISDDWCFEPDAIVAPLPKPPHHTMIVPAPLIVIEVLSHDLRDFKRDLTTKLAGYARVASIEHYLVIDAGERTVLHFRRRGDLLTQVSELTEGTLRLDPPGLEIPVAEMLLPPDDGKSATT